MVGGGLAGARLAWHRGDGRDAGPCRLAWAWFFAGPHRRQGVRVLCPRSLVAGGPAGDLSVRGQAGRRRVRLALGMLGRRLPGVGLGLPGSGRLLPPRGGLFPRRLRAAPAGTVVNAAADAVRPGLGCVREFCGSRRLGGSGLGGSGLGGSGLGGSGLGGLGSRGRRW
ncbi:hypothetical protein B5P43_31585 [Bacillus sp. SRB_336]|nr:hypothetical protein B5P43_31585 [Bacillus sp. SRB_336]